MNVVCCSRDWPFKGLVLLPFSNWVNPFRKKFAPAGATLREEIFLKGCCCPKKQTGSNKSCFPLLKWWQNMVMYPFTLS